jgi:hypothetical protein
MGRGRYSAAPAGVDHRRTPVTDPIRDIAVGDITISSGDVDIEVTHDGRVATFTAEVWNLTQQTFADIRAGESMEIQLGWAAASADRVLTGHLTEKDTRPTAAGRTDTKYVLRGASDGARGVRRHATASWRDATANTIVRGIAAEAGLEVGVLGPGADADVRGAAPRFDGYWQVRETQPLRSWLDSLAREAAAKTGTQFEWYVDRGALSFHPKRWLPERTVTMSTADEIKRRTPATGDTTQTNDVDAHRFEAYCQPTIQKHARLAVTHTPGGKARRQGGRLPNQPTTPGDGVDARTDEYRIVSYRYQTGSTIGHHNCSVLAVPSRAKYTATGRETEVGVNG